LAIYFAKWQLTLKGNATCIFNLHFGVFAQNDKYLRKHWSVKDKKKAPGFLFFPLAQAKLTNPMPLERLPVLPCGIPLHLPL
jgi:hypothetical protein